MTVLLIRDAEVNGRPGIDIRLRDGLVEQVGPGLPTAGAEVLAAHGGAVVPGLHDHHLHLHASAADAASVRCGPPAVRDRAALAAALATAPADESGWVRGVGYIETVAGDLDATALDALHAGRPVRIQHRSGALWMLNSAALAAAALSEATHSGLERDAGGNPTGRIWRADTWLRTRLPRTAPPDLRALGRTLTRYGITGVTDATPDLSPRSRSALVAAADDGIIPQRLHLLGVPLDSAAPDSDRVTVGPYKIVIADSALPDLDHLVQRIQHAHQRNRAVAVHCVTRAALLLFLAALDVTGARPGDRVEHGALIPPDVDDDIRRHRLSVVTQPGFLADRGDDYLRDIAPDDLPDLYRCRSLLDARIPLALSSDAPYGPLDPWAVIAAAATRITPEGTALNPAESLTPRQALDAYLAPAHAPGGAPRIVRPGVPADLVVLHTPSALALRRPSADHVRYTIIDGIPFPA
ncbi:amidohydrolase family protein [Nocardia arizonensis]|uniref:amidohydrolase family protein n=1 Tax=Nocardia arizonensis TaxID=1141647 RepID=UPI0006CFB399|nr:amidohydrolase family protein [Nocardia arizonensis]